MGSKHIKEIQVTFHRLSMCPCKDLYFQVPPQTSQTRGVYTIAMILTFKTFSSTVTLVAPACTGTRIGLAICGFQVDGGTLGEWLFNCPNSKLVNIPKKRAERDESRIKPSIIINCTSILAILSDTSTDDVDEIYRYKIHSAIPVQLLTILQLIVSLWNISEPGRGRSCLDGDHRGEASELELCAVQQLQLGARLGGVLGGHRWAKRRQEGLQGKLRLGIPMGLSWAHE